MNDLTRANRHHIPIALVCEHNPIWQGPINACRHGRCPSMWGLDKIDIKKVVCKNRASHRSHPNHALPDFHFINHFCQQAVRHAVGTTRAVTCQHIRQGIGTLINDIFSKCII